MIPEIFRLAFLFAWGIIAVSQGNELYYKNLTGNIYGPFPREQVHGWWAAGYFNDGSAFHN